MKIQVDNQDIFELTETQKNVIKNDINADIFEDDMKRRLQWVLMHKYEQCFKRLKAEWDKKLPSLGIETIPTNLDAYAELVFSLPEYKDRKTRDTDIKYPKNQ